MGRDILLVQGRRQRFSRGSEASKITDENAETRAADAFLELEDRIAVCGLRKKAINSYPFVLNATKTSLEVKYPFRSTF